MPMRLPIRVVALAGFAAVSAKAQTFPDRQITIVVPFAAGGPTDLVARDRLSREVCWVNEDMATAGRLAAVGADAIASSPKCVACPRAGIIAAIKARSHHAPQVAALSREPCVRSN